MKKLEVGDRQVDTKGDPDPRQHGVEALAEQRLDPEVPLDPLEEQLDPPAFLVEGGDGGGGG